MDYYTRPDIDPIDDFAPILTPKQLLFCQEYLVDLNGTKAAIRAGYSENGASAEASRLLTNAKVQREVERLKAERAERCRVTHDMITKEFAKIAFANTTNYVEVKYKIIGYDEDSLEPIYGKVVDVVETKKLSKDETAAISEIVQTKNGISFKLHDRQRALENLAKHTGYYEKDNEQQNKIVVQPTAEELRASRKKLEEDF